MKTIKSKTRTLVQQILNQSFLDANKTLTSLVLEAQEDRENDIEQDASQVQDVEETEETADDSDTEQVETDKLDQPSNGSPNLGDSLDNSVEDAAVSQGQVDQMTNDVVEINCEVNQKIISKLYDKISNLKTTLSSNDMDKDTRQYITLETKLSYYGNKLEQLQSKTNPAIDQEKVQEKIDIIDAALKTLQAEIGGSSGNEVDDVDSTMDLDENSQEESSDQLGDTAQSQEQSQSEDQTEGQAQEQGQEQSQEQAEQQAQEQAPQENA